jgi:hypothetical protein
MTIAIKYYLRMKPLYSRIIFCTALFASIAILIIGTILGTNGLIIGGVVGIFGSTILGTTLMINNSTSIKETDNNPKDTNTIVIIYNPIT